MMKSELQVCSLTCECWVLGPFKVNSYLLFDDESRELIIVDPADAPEKFLNHIAGLNPSKTTIVLTHGHADHIAGLNAVRTKTGAQVACSALDAPMLTDPVLNLSSFMGESIVAKPPDIILKEGDVLKLGKQEGRVVAVPGHTPGGIALVFDTLIISGDTLFARSIGRSDFPGGDGHLLVRMIREKFLSLSDRPVFPGHGPETTIAAEIAENPFIADD